MNRPTPCARAQCQNPAASYPVLRIPAVGGDKANALELPAANLPLCRGHAKKIHVGEFLKNGGTLRAKVNRFCKLLEGTVKPDFKGAWLDFKPLGE